MNVKRIGLISLFSLSVVACGGSGGSADKSQPLVESDTSALKNRAAASLGVQFDTNAQAATTVANRNRSLLLDTTAEIAVGGNETLSEDIEFEPVVENSIQGLVEASLAIGDDSKGVTSRTGNTININPDEVAVCDELMDTGDVVASEIDDCISLMENLTVQLIASGEESGELNYLFKNASVLKLGYAPNMESVELGLSGLNRFIESAAELDPESDTTDFPQEMSGSMKFTTTTNNANEGQEAGSLAWDIVNPVSIEAVNENGVTESLNMATGTLVAMDVDAGSGVGSMSMDVGAISSVFSSEGGLGRLNLAGFTANADISADNGSLVVSNMGLSRGPMSISIDNEEVLKMTLEAIGFRVDEDSDSVVIDGELDLTLFVDGAIDARLEDSSTASAMISAMAASGTTFSRAGNGNIRIGGTGPFSVTIGATSTEGEFQESVVTANSGECIDDFTPDDESAASAENCL